MYKKLLLSISTALFLSGCGIDYDGTTKLIFEGRLTNPNGQPLPGIKVSTHVSNTYYNDEISFDTTDSNGYYRMMFPKADGIVNTEVQINASVYEQIDDASYSSVTIVNIDQQLINDYKIDMGTTQLYQKFDSVRLTLDLNNTSGSSIVKINALGLTDNNTIDYNFEKLYTNKTDDYIYNIVTEYNVAKNQEVTIKYLLSNGTVNQVKVPVGQENVTYKLNY